MSVPHTTTRHPEQGQVVKGNLPPSAYLASEATPYDATLVLPGRDDGHNAHHGLVLHL